jgi:hypothetical protein
VGELLYHLLTGHHYIDLDEIKTQASAMEKNIRHEIKLYMLLEKAICTDPPPGLPALRHEVGGVANVIEKALAKDKAARYDDLLDLAADLWAAQFDPSVARA